MQPPQFIKALAPQTIPEGEVGVLDVEVTALPEAKFSWYKHGMKITEDEELEISITSEGNKSKLILGEIFDDDSGEYKVTAENVVGRTSSSATVMVESEINEDCVAPEFTQHIKPLKVMDGESVKFEGVVTGNPVPRITWFHAGKPVGHHREVKTLQNRKGVVGLAISEVFPEDSGDYTCVAKNIAGETRSIASLTVEG